MMGIEPAGQRPERRHDQLGRREDEAAPGDMAALEVDPELGMEMARDFGRRIGRRGFMAKDDPGELGLLDDAAAAMIGE
jgi:hypothetical protein